MSRKRASFLVLSLAVMIPVVTGVLWSAATERRADDGEDSLYKYLSIFSEVFALSVFAPRMTAILPPMCT